MNASKFYFLAKSTKILQQHKHSTWQCSYDDDNYDDLWNGGFDDNDDDSNDYDYDDDDDFDYDDECDDYYG